MTSHLARTILLFSILLIGTYGCTESNPNSAINQASLLINSNAKEALSILEKINPQTLSPEDRAKFGLLFSIANERNGIIISSDSIIVPSLQYYSKKENEEKPYALSLLFYGQAMQSNGSIKDATESYLDLISILHSTPSDTMLLRAKAIALHNLGSIHFEQGYFEEAIQYYKKAADNFDSINKEQSHKIYFMMANAYTRLGKLRKGINLIDSLQTVTSDPEFKLWLNLTALSKCIHAEDSVAYSLAELTERHRRIDLSVLQSTSNKGEWSETPAFMYNTLSALLAYRKGDAKTAYSHIVKSFKEIGEITSLNVGYYSAAAEIARTAGELDAALAYQRIYSSKKDSINIHTKEQQVRQIEGEYLDNKEKEVALLTAHYQLYLAISIILVIVIVAFMAIKLYQRKIIVQKKEIEEFLTITENYRQNNNSISEKLQESNTREAAIKGYLASRKDLVQQIAQSYYTYGDGKHFAEKMHDIALSPEMLADLIELTDYYTDGVISRLKTDFPQWTAKNYNFAALIIAGFSPQEISVMLSMTLGGVYTQKSKLKTKIMQHEGDEVSLFIKYFS